MEMGKGTEMSFCPAGDLLTILTLNLMAGRTVEGLSGGQDVDAAADDDTGSPFLRLTFYAQYSIWSSFQSFQIGTVIIVPSTEEAGLSKQPGSHSQHTEEAEAGPGAVKSQQVPGRTLPGIVFRNLSFPRVKGSGGKWKDACHHPRPL